MKKKKVMQLLCITMTAVMIVANGTVTQADGGVQKTAIYNENTIVVRVDGDTVILPDGQTILLKDFSGQFIEETGNTAGNAGGDNIGGGTEPEGEGPTEPEGEGPTEPEGEGPTEPEGEGPTEPEGEGPTEPEEEGPTEPEEEGPTEPEGGSPTEPDTGQAAPARKPQQESREQKKEQSNKKTTETTASGLFFNNQGIVNPEVTGGKSLYIEELKEKYKLEFSDEFEEVVKEIEAYYEKEALREKALREKTLEETPEEITEETPEETTEEAPEETTEETLEETTEETLEETTEEEKSEEELTVKNWQDMLAVYLLKEKRSGKETFVLDASAKEDLMEIFGEMNSIADTEEVAYEPIFIEQYIEKNKDMLNPEEQKFLETYTSSSCTLLCAAATGLPGFITESLGEEVSQERARIVASAFSLVGKVNYFWGGKSSVIGWDSRWGEEAMVTSAGSRSTGTVKAYGLDCSGYVTWAFVNGYENKEAQNLIGHGTTAQWNLSEEVSQEEALPGDLLFLQPPGASGINHIGIVVGRNDDDSLVAAHCGSSKNGVVIQSAYEAGFRYIRRPLAYDDSQSEDTENIKKSQLQLEKQQIESSKNKEVEKDGNS